MKKYYIVTLKKDKKRRILIFLMQVFAKIVAIMQLKYLFSNRKVKHNLIPAKNERTIHYRI